MQEESEAEPVIKAAEPSLHSLFPVIPLSSPTVGSNMHGTESGLGLYSDWELASHPEDGESLVRSQVYFGVSWTDDLGSV